ncbi:hypothetical protein BK126_26725 [Paenibacillus sp. FSL H7-0326]|uniref:hypothetical protein n=1 Tax=Paenibacillus sp. FSL H7-0326 TaxID=1921144 RepID=UPI00096E5723|nr:hypothetical protein [Paenibacillus sp. FSL H7-0326]OMC63786.1 hypothetical protein BK126_26725 [Paenibacillus sp. FSL H7-0326]
MELIKSDQVNAEEWNNVFSLEDCPPLNMKVLAFHDSQIFIGFFEKDGDGYCWRLENGDSIQWVDTFEVESWLDIVNE